MKKMLVLIFTLVAVAAVCFAGCQTEPQETQPPVMDAYWNMNGAEYNNNGVSSRKPESDGTYKIMTFYQKKAVTLKVADKVLVDKIDSMRIFGVTLNEEGVVTAVKTVEDMGGKIICDGFTVETGAAFEMNVIGPDGKTVNLKTPTRSCYVADVFSDPTDPLRIYGDELIRGDKIVAVQDYNGEITNVFFYEPGLIRSGKEMYCPHCCKEGETTHFDAWTQYTSAIQESGHWFLYQDLELADQIGTYADVEAVLDLNGFTVTVMGEHRICAVNGKNSYLGIMDTSEEKTGTLLAISDTYAGKGGVVWVTGDNAKFELFSGILDGSVLSAIYHGAAVKLEKLSCTFVMHDGEIIGGSTTNLYNEETGKWSGGGHGGSVCTNGTFIMYGGLIHGGSANTGINEAGAISGQGRGGNIAVMNGATFEMYGGNIYDGTCDNPTYAETEGDIYIAKTAIVKLEGGSFEAPAASAPETQG